MIRFWWVLSVLLLVSCGPITLEDYREEGRIVTKLLIKELRKIKTRKQLSASTVKLQKLFDRLVDVILEAQELRASTGQELIELARVDHELSDALRSELNRLYGLDGGRALIEKAQEKPFSRLTKK